MRQSASFEPKNVNEVADYHEERASSQKVLKSCPESNVCKVEADCLEDVAHVMSPFK